MYYEKIQKDILDIVEEGSRNDEHKLTPLRIKDYFAKLDVEDELRRDEIFARHLRAYEENSPESDKIKEWTAALDLILNPPFIDLSSDLRKVQATGGEHEKASWI